MLRAAALAVSLTAVAPSPSAPPPHAAMVHIRGGEFSMGTADPRGKDHGGDQAMDDARPVHRVSVRGFWIDRTDITNAQFARFVTATGYVTVAERAPDPRDFPGVPRDQLRPGAIVFTRPEQPVSLDDPYRWWSYVPGANWRHPLGPASSIATRDHDPVVQIAYADAE